MKRILSVLLAALMLTLLLAGCGAKSEMAEDNGVYYPAEKPEAGGDYLYGSTTGSLPNAAVTDQKLVKTVYIHAETEEFDQLMTNLDETVTRLGGYVESRDLYNGSPSSTYCSRNASLCVRIPADKLSSFTEHVADISNIISSTETVENVTLTYVSMESRIKALQTEEARLLEFMEQAKNMSDLLEVEARLTQVRGELESITSQFRVLENQVSYATVELDIREVRQLTVVQEQTVWQRISSGFMENLRDLGDDLVDLFVGLIVSLPDHIPMALAVVAIVLLIRRRIRRKKKAATPPPQITEE